VAEEGFDRVFRNRQAPADVPEHPAPDGDPIWLPGALHDAGLVKSNSEGKRLVAQGAVKIDGDAVMSEDTPRGELIDRIVSVGKRRFVRFTS
jgi:tyrosyl-tRNA synthetase